MQQRLISAAVLVPVVVIAFLLGAPWLTFGIAILAAVAAYEAATLMTKTGLPATKWFAVVVTPLLVLGLAWLSGPIVLLPSLSLGYLFVAPAIASVIVLSAILAFRQRDPADGFRAWIGTTMATLYPALLGFAAVFIGLTPQSQTGSLFGIHLDFGRILFLTLLLTVWATDTGAYLTGRTFGRHKLSPHISPNKTWEGAIGGVVAAVVACTLLMLGSGQLLSTGLLVGLMIGITGQAGDLAESLLKRAAGEKDSGRLIPGHGGILDRVDSFLFAAPAMYATLFVIGELYQRGIVL